METRTLALTALVILTALALLMAGCTSQGPTKSGPSTATKISTPPGFTATPQSTVHAGPGTPGPTQALPDIYSLEFQVQANGNTVNPKVAVVLRGGKGMDLDSRVDITFHKTTGEVSNATMLQPFSSGQQAVFDASPDNYNRVEIWVTAPQVGKIKTFDDYVPFSTYNSNP